MKKLILAAAVVTLLAGCSSQKEFVKSPANLSPCRNQIQVKANEYFGETAENLDAYQTDKGVTVSFAVKTACTSNLDYDIQNANGLVKVRLKNLGAQTTDCVCTKDFTVALNDLLEPGTYTIMITNDNGYQMLAQKTGVVVK